MPHAGGWEPSGRQAVHPGPVESRALAAAPQRLEPVSRHLGAEGRHGVGVAGHGVVGEVASHHGCQPLPLHRDGLVPASLERGVDLA